MEENGNFSRQLEALQTNFIEYREGRDSEVTSLQKEIDEHRRKAQLEEHREERANEI